MVLLPVPHTTTQPRTARKLKLHLQRLVVNEAVHGGWRSAHGRQLTASDIRGSGVHSAHAWPPFPRRCRRKTGLQSAPQAVRSRAATCAPCVQTDDDGPGGSTVCQRIHQRIRAGGGGWIAVRERQIPWWKIAGELRENCGKLREIEGKLRCHNQTSQSLKEQHFCTGDTGHRQIRRTKSNCGKIAQNCGKLQETAGNCKQKNCEIAKNCEKMRTSIPPHDQNRCVLVTVRKPGDGHGYQGGASCQRAYSVR